MKFITITLLAFITTASYAQSGAENKTKADLPIIKGRVSMWHDPSIGAIGASPLRSEFISYDIRNDAENGLREVSPFFLPLNMFSTQREGVQQLRTRVDIPYMWLDRELFLHVEGLQSFVVGVNDKRIAYGQDSRTPSEFNISSSVTNGLNTISLTKFTEGVGATLETAITQPAVPTVFLYSQPKLRIEDFLVQTIPDSTKQHYEITLKVALANSYNSQELITVGFDIYSPAGKLLQYDLHDAQLKGQSGDTVTFKHTVYRANLWSTEHPQQYSAMLYVKRNGRITEYIPFKIGIGTVSVSNGKIERNGKILDMKPAAYNGAPTSTQLIAELTRLKTHGINTVVLDYPQPWWFYNVCDKVGMNVIDQANINTDFDTVNPNVGGALSNNPLWLNSFILRLKSMYMRNRNHACIVGWSLAGKVGNGYNMYKCYEWLKQADPQRAIIFRDSQGQWNNDVTLPQIVDAAKLIATPAPKTKTAVVRRRR